MLPEETAGLISLLKDMNKTLKELNAKTMPLANASMTLAYNTAVTTEKRYDAHELLGVPKNVKIVQIAVLDKGGGLTIRVNGDDYALTTANGSKFTDELIESVGLVGGGAGTAYIRFGFYIPETI